MAETKTMQKRRPRLTSPAPHATSGDSPLPVFLLPRPLCSLGPCLCQTPAPCHPERSASQRSRKPALSESAWRTSRTGTCGGSFRASEGAGAFSGSRKLQMRKHEVSGHDFSRAVSATLNIGL